MRASIWIAIALVTAGCGYVGDPLPPALNIASQVTDLAVIERADQLAARFTIPELTTDGVLLKRIGKVELRIAEGGMDADGGRTIAVEAPAPGQVHAEIPAAPWVDKDVVIGVRIVNAKGRASKWSNLVSLRVIPPLARPERLVADSDPKGARLTWEGPAGPYRILRDKQLLATTPSSPYLDETARLGVEYHYAVQAAREHAESPLSETVALTPVDRFPPAVPAGVTAVAGIGAIELVWDRNTEADLKGYRLYRASDGAAFAPLGDVLDAPAYSDHTVESGKRYRYRISAIDQAGNESQPSAEAAAIAP